jgi:integrase
MWQGTLAGNSSQAGRLPLNLVRSFLVMARPRKPWYRSDRNAWFVEVDGKQVPLGQHPDTFPSPQKSKNGWNPPPPIVAAYGRVMETRGNEPEAPSPKDSVVSLLGSFLSWTKTNKSAATYEQRRYFLHSFVKHRGVKNLRPDRVSVELVENWLDSHPKWKASRRHATLCLLRAFNWSAKRGKIPKNPISAIEIPVQTRNLNYLTTEQRKKLFEVTKDKSFQNVLTALSETGCRPGEICSVNAADVNLEVGVWVLKNHKMGTKTGKPRIVYLTDTMVALTRELAAKNPTGPLFLNYRKKPWNRNSIRCRFRVFRKLFPDFGHFTAYSYRRAFVTDALEKGVDVAQVAELMGHSGTDMVMRHYNQLQERVAHMREMAKRAAG